MQSYYVHPSAIVDAGASIGEGTEIWHFCHVSSGARIGRGCTLGQNVYVAPGVKIGDGVRIQNNVSVYAGVVLEDYVFCGPSMVFTNVKAPRAAFPRDAAEYAVTRVGYGASIGANATVVCGVAVGQWALVGAGAVITRDVPDYGLSVGVPGRLEGWVCQCGEALCFDNARATCQACDRRYAEQGAGHVVLVR